MMGNAVNLYLALALAVLAWCAIGYCGYSDARAWRNRSRRHGGRQ